MTDSANATNDQAEKPTKKKNAIAKLAFALVCCSEQAILQSAELDFRTCLVHALCNDGVEFLAGVAA